MRKWFAVDQWGTHQVFFATHPRKSLLEYHGVKAATRMYIDTADHRSLHIGWIIAGHWYRVYLLTPIHEVSK